MLRIHHGWGAFVGLQWRDECVVDSFARNGKAQSAAGPDARCSAAQAASQTLVKGVYAGTMMFAVGSGPAEPFELHWREPWKVS